MSSGDPSDTSLPSEQFVSDGETQEDSARDERQQDDIPLPRDQTGDGEQQRAEETKASKNKQRAHGPLGLLQ
ncbi:MAG: hypothetical protein R3B96_08310 [Pirellulaceae bacterium]